MSARKTGSTTGHELHPGYDAPTCPLRITINAHPFGTSHNGFACSWTGGHCLPFDNPCDDYRAEARQQNEILEGSDANE